MHPEAFRQRCGLCAGQVAVLRLLQQLSQVYSVMRVASLAALVPFFTFGEVEQLIVDAVKHNYLHVRAAPCALSGDLACVW